MIYLVLEEVLGFEFQFRAYSNDKTVAAKDYNF